ncbi:DsbA family protein [Tunturibacter empetritectus]|uniref:Protein-disulfide isomerase n=1 Tax=Tunturiibacter lichenicola TaxID=2051959 RepID=A0A7W8N624_9BACT|nr:thioredoxin domain-containing protein [Edaphobacter lichenicola]MBB5344600.1 protein-disulfide isomerase [Edaphobacter lichenicola]
MLIAVKPFRALIFASTLAALGCHAQTSSQTANQTGASASDKLSPELTRRVEVLIRSRASIPPAYVIQIGSRTRSEVPGFDKISVTFLADGKSSKPADFLLSTDGKTLAQFTRFDISQDPKLLVSGDGRPSRGGPANAPVLIVGFDDLECPYCAKMHEQLFPALTERYKDQIHIVYRDFPLDQHPWAMRAAIDTNCVGAHSPIGYWNLVDYIHAHAGELGGPDKSLAKANETLDTLARDEGKKQNLNAELLNACLTKQDDTAIKASIKLGESLGVDSTPALFINGEKVEGAQPLEDVYRMIDSALIASGQTPPPPPTPIQAQPQTPPATKPGN